MARVCKELIAMPVSLECYFICLAILGQMLSMPSTAVLDTCLILMYRMRRLSSTLDAISRLQKKKVSSLNQVPV
ncbi:hypothetical protein ACHAW6_012278 [Cyclotella cf. meneghiniana]